MLIQFLNEFNEQSSVSLTLDSSFQKELMPYFHIDK